MYSSHPALIMAVSTVQHRFQGTTGDTPIIFHHYPLFGDLAHASEGSQEITRG